MVKVIVFSGLPGVGKTTQAKHLALDIHATYLRVDSIEKPFLDLGDVEGRGYEALCALAKDNLVNNMDVVIDTVNPLHITRQMFISLAKENNAEIVQFECRLDDKVEHRRRVESRCSNEQHNPTWQEVEDRQYENWDEKINGKRFIIDMINENDSYEQIERSIKL